LVVVDQEIGGIQRLAHLLPDAPALADMHEMKDADLEIFFAVAAQAAKQLGVNTFLAPIVDTLTGPNPWLSGRTVSDQVDEVARLSRCFVRAGEAAGVMSVVKHFPGNAHVPLDPATQVRAIVEGSLTSLSIGFPAFEACIKEGAGGMMLGPAPVPAIDASCAASCSAVVVDLLRAHFAFGGVVVSDGLEAAATAAGRPVADVAVQALNAGVELLLVGCDERLPQLAVDIAAAVGRGELDEAVLLRASEKVAQSIAKYGEHAG
jgi:beta-N-acetylhexosaminidase